jgi:short-subunit dehydrogenase
MPNQPLAHAKFAQAAIKIIVINSGLAVRSRSATYEFTKVADLIEINTTIGLHFVHPFNQGVSG